MRELLEAARENLRPLVRSRESVESRLARESHNRAERLRGAASDKNRSGSAARERSDAARGRADVAAEETGTRVVRGNERGANNPDDQPE